MLSKSRGILSGELVAIKVNSAIINPKTFESFGKVINRVKSLRYLYFRKVLQK